MSSSPFADISEVLSASAGKPAKFLYTGGSIPVVARFAQVSGAMPLLIGHGLPDDKIHQANESMSLLQHRVGFTGLAEVLSRL